MTYTPGTLANWISGHFYCISFLFYRNDDDPGWWTAFAYVDDNDYHIRCFLTHSRNPSATDKGNVYE